jgi:hypothetical protein
MRNATTTTIRRQPHRRTPSYELIRGRESPPGQVPGGPCERAAATREGDRSPPLIVCARTKPRTASAARQLAEQGPCASWCWAGS